MTKQPLNLYASRILQESPLCIWPIDEKSDYFNFVLDHQAAVTVASGWTVNNATSEVISKPLGTEPFLESPTTRVVGSGNGDIELISPVLANFSELNSYLATFTTSAFLMFSSQSVQSVSIGITYVDSITGNVNIQKSFPIFNYNSWLQISETFDMPNEFTQDIKLVIRIKYDQSQQMICYINGISFAQWSEEFMATSLGSAMSTIPPTVYGFPNGSKAIRAYASGEPDNDGFIVVDGSSKINARSTGLPIVYGAQNSSLVEWAQGGNPSIIIPANGVLMNDDKYSVRTLEFWAKITNNSNEPFRIVGPIGSSDGLYVDGPFLKLQIGNQVGHYSVIEWGRPMLIHIVLQSNTFELLVNGSKVISLPIDKSTLTLSEKIINGKDANWIGFYGSEDVEPFEIDCISIYTYAVSQGVAKKRFLFGQGVELPTSLNTAYNGKTITFDYEFSKYSQNMDYPNKSSWAKGVSNNILVNPASIKLPEYTPPKLNISDSTEGLFLTNLASKQNDLSGTFISFDQYPNSYMVFDNMNVIRDQVKAVYALIKTTADHNGQTILSIRDNVSNNRISFVVEDNKIKCKSYVNSRVQVLSELEYINGEVIPIGFSIDRISSYFGGDVRSLLSSLQNLSVFVGGDKDAPSFTGKIFSFAFMNENNFNETSDAFDQIGFIWNTTSSLDIDFISGTTWNSSGVEGTVLTIADAGTNLYTNKFMQYLYDGGTPSGYANDLLNTYTPAYRILVIKDNNACVLDVASSGTWSDNIPLSFFSKPYKDQAGIQHSGVDYIQVNLSYPSPQKFEKIEETNNAGWDYSALQNSFALPVQKQYSDLDNHLYTGYVDYESLKINTKFSYKYNTEDALVRTYVYFKQIGSSLYSDKYYSNKELTPKTKVVIPGEEWTNTKYEIVDNTIVYMPPNIDFDKVTMCFDIVFNVNGIAHKPIYINKLSFASQTFNKTSAKPIGTKYGYDVYPFSQNGFYYDYKAVNPISITKQSTPYLYMSRNNGISVLGEMNKNVTRGIYIPINKEKSSNYKVAAFNSFMMYDYDFFPYSPQEIFGIKSNRSHIKFYLQSVHPEGKRAKIFAINQKTGQLENGISFFLNGKIVKDPVINLRQWFSLGIVFATYVDMSGHEGYIEITGPMQFDNISYYAANRLQQVQVTTERSWNRVVTPFFDNVDWMFWMPYIWQEVLVISNRSYYSINPEDIFKQYTGTSRIIVEDTQKLKTKYYQYRVTNQVTKANSVHTPA
jgi:hypothetical protein